MYDKSKWKTVVEKHGNIIAVHFTGGGECLCYYNACGEDASLCSYCFNLSDASKELEQVKAGSYNCRGFQRAEKRKGDEADV